MKRSHLLLLIRTAIFTLFCLWSLCHVDAVRDRHVPHAHKGILTPHEPGPFSLSLEDDDEKDLSQGKAVMKQSMPKGSSAGGAVCVQDINAPPDAVWNQILRMDDYKGKVPSVLECHNYHVSQADNGYITMKTKQRIGILPGYSYENYYNHKYIPDQNSMTWNLDYEKTSDFNDVAGHWHIENHPHKPKCTRVFYACDIKLKNPPPKPVLSFLSKSALKTATSWVKRESEAAPNAPFPQEFVHIEPESSTVGGRFSDFGRRRV